MEHPNLVKLIDVIPKLDRIYLVFEYCQGDLFQLLSSWKGNPPRDPILIKTMLKQILMGVHACHCSRIMHRDMKPQNILIGSDDQLKLADFGLARAFSVPMKPFTHEVVTIWYRAPEILLGATEYSIAVDMWSVGCIFYEICKLQPLFNGTDEIQMLKMIF